MVHLSTETVPDDSYQQSIMLLMAQEACIMVSTDGPVMALYLFKINKGYGSM